MNTLYSKVFVRGDSFWGQLGAWRGREEGRERGKERGGKREKEEENMETPERIELAEW